MSGSLVAAALILLAGLAIVGFSVYQKKLASDTELGLAETAAARDVAIHGQDVQLSIAHETKPSGAAAVLSAIGGITKGIGGVLGGIL